MRKAIRSKSSKPDFNQYLGLVMSLKGDALREWNREGIRRSRLLEKEMSEARSSNVQKYLRTLDAKDPQADHGTYHGEITLKWEIDVEPGECRLHVNADDCRGDFGLLGGHAVVDLVTVKRFMSLINQHLVAASLSLFEASAIYSSERVLKSNPRYWQQRFMNEQVQRLDALTGRSKKFGRPVNTRKSILRKENEAISLKADVIRAVRNLYAGTPNGTYRCPSHKQDECPGHDDAEIDVERVAQYLNRARGTLSNQLSKAKLKFIDLKKEALKSVTH